MIERAVFEDLEEILRVQKAAFYPVALAERNDRIPPLMQTQEEIEDEFTRRTFLKYVHDGKIIGSVRAHLDENRVCQIGKLVVLPEHQGKGIGTALMEAIEQEFEDCLAYELFTGAMHVHTVAFYHRLGYQTVSKRDFGGVSMEFMKKERVPQSR